jgi:hypothetical protein
MLIARCSNFCMISDVSRELSSFACISISGFLGKLVDKAAEVVTQSLQSPFPLWDSGILSIGVGFVYKVLEEKSPRKTTQHDIKKISEEVRKQQDRDELDQIDRQNTVRNERDDRSAPANLEQM